MKRKCEDADRRWLEWKLPRLRDLNFACRGDSAPSGKRLFRSGSTRSAAGPAGAGVMFYLPAIRFTFHVLAWMSAPKGQFVSLPIGLDWCGVGFGGDAATRRARGPEDSRRRNRRLLFFPFFSWTIRHPKRRMGKQRKREMTEMICPASNQEHRPFRWPPLKRAGC